VLPCHGVDDGGNRDIAILLHSPSSRFGLKLCLLQQSEAFFSDSMTN
jgi:hypothetical protein